MLFCASLLALSRGRCGLVVFFFVVVVGFWYWVGREDDGVERKEKVDDEEGELEDGEDEACFGLLAEPNIGLEFGDAAAILDIPRCAIVGVFGINSVWCGLSVDAICIQTHKNEMCNKREECREPLEEDHDGLGDESKHAQHGAYYVELCDE